VRFSSSDVPDVRALKIKKTSDQEGSEFRDSSATSVPQLDADLSGNSRADLVGQIVDGEMASGRG